MSLPNTGFIPGDEAEPTMASGPPKGVSTNKQHQHRHGDSKMEHRYRKTIWTAVSYAHVTTR